MKWYAIKRLFRTRKRGKQRSSYKRKKTKSPLWRRRIILALRVLMVLFVADIFYLTTIWPDWDAIKAGRIGKSQFIQLYEQQRADDPLLPRLRWKPVSYRQLPPALIRSVIVAEDGRFYSHRGFDLQALSEAFEINLEQGKLAYGASTISQQTVKNMFLSPSRNPLRKWHELILTLGMEFRLSKRQIIWLYLNIAEFGEGIFGAEAAAQHYWGIPAAELSRRQSVELAASLPSPKRHNPATRSERFLQRCEKIERYLSLRYDDY